MKNLLIINGSPHSDGATAVLIGTVEQAVKGAVCVGRVDCYAARPLPCDDCGFCRTAEGCAKPDLKDFYVRLEEADYVVFACPVYNGSFPAPMKALIDRLQRYWSARFVRGKRPPITRPKRALLLTVCGSDKDDMGQMLEQQLRPALTVLNTTLTAAVHAVGTDGKNDMSRFVDQTAKAVNAMINNEL